MSEIKIAAFLSVSNPSSCKFVVEGAELLPGRAADYAGKDSAADAPLAAKLLALDGVLAVRVQKNNVIVTRNKPDDWAPAAKAMGAVVREVLESGAAPVPADAGKELMADDELAEKIREVLDSEVATAVAGHGGSIHLDGVKDGDVYLRMGGACQGCASSTATLKQGVERALRAAVPDIGEIVDVTDHDAGSNPYYK